MISSFAPSYAGATSPHTGQFSRRRWISAQGLVPEFHDIDLTIADGNTDRAREILCEIRTLQSLTLQGEYYPSDGPHGQGRADSAGAYRAAVDDNRSEDEQLSLSRKVVYDGYPPDGGSGLSPCRRSEDGFELKGYVKVPRLYYEAAGLFRPIDTRHNGRSRSLFQQTQAAPGGSGRRLCYFLSQASHFCSPRGGVYSFPVRLSGTIFTMHVAGRHLSMLSFRRYVYFGASSSTSSKIAFTRSPSSSTISARPRRMALV